MQMFVEGLGESRGSQCQGHGFKPGFLSAPLRMF